MTASTSEDHIALVPSFQCSVGSTALNIRAVGVEMGIGASGSEKALGDTYWYGTDGTEFMDGPSNSFPHFQDFPSGSRLSMRGSNSGTIGGTSDGVIHGVS
jgi:hypothetical protein